MRNWNAHVLSHRTQQRARSWMNTTKTRNWNVNNLLRSRLLERGKRHNGGHFHQLFRHLRRTEHRARAAGWRRDLGHFDNLLDGCLHVNEPEDVHQLFSHLRHRHIEYLHVRQDVDDVLRRVPMDPLLPTSNLRQRCWPVPSGERAPGTWPCSTSRASLPVLVAVLWFRGTPCEWCCTEARTIWIAICSWRQNERNLRSRRTRAAHACSPCTGMSTTGLSTETGLTKRKRNPVEPGGGGGGADEMLQWCVSPYHCTDAPSWGGRTPGSQTPGVPATLGLNVQMDGGRKMLQNCGKLPLIAATMPTLLLPTKMSTSSGDELKMGHFHCRNHHCMITGTSITVDELRQVIDQATVGSRLSPTTAHNLLDLQNKRRPPYQCTVKGESLWKSDQGNLHLRHDRDVNDFVQRRRRAATVGSRLSPTTAHEQLDLHNKHRSLCQCAAIGEELRSAEQQDHGNRPPRPEIDDQRWTATAETPQFSAVETQKPP